MSQVYGMHSCISECVHELGASRNGLFCYSDVVETCHNPNTVAIGFEVVRSTGEYRMSNNHPKLGRLRDLKILMEYKKGMLHKEPPSFIMKFYDMVVKALADKTAKWHELNPRCPNSRLKEDKYKQDDFNVLNHGDFRVNNMMFRYDEQGKPVDLMLVDFQISHHDSPAEDILFFFGISPSDEVRMHHREFILLKYHVTLTRTMAKLECSTEAPNFDTLPEMLRKRALYEVVIAFTLLPLVLVDKSKVKSLDDLASSDEKYDNPAYQKKSYRKVMTRLLPLYNDMGLLDV